MDDAGTFDELRHRHDALVSRMSPTARHQAFPTVYARPIPREATKVADPTLPLRGEIALLREELAAQKRENGRLAILLRELSRPRPVAYWSQGAHHDWRGYGGRKRTSPTPDELRAERARHRSPLVLRCVEDALTGADTPLSLIRDLRFPGDR